MDITTQALMKQVINTQAMVRVLLQEMAELKAKDTSQTPEQYFEDLMEEVNRQINIISEDPLS